MKLGPCSNVYPARREKGEGTQASKLAIFSQITTPASRLPACDRSPNDKEMIMRHVIRIAIVGFCLTLGTVYGKPPEENPEVASFQKLEQLVSKQVEVGVASKNQLLKVRILELRMLFTNGKLTQERWLAKEQQLNAELLGIQLSEVSQGDKAINQVFEFQNSLLSTREMLMRNAEPRKSE